MTDCLSPCFPYPPAAPLPSLPRPPSRCLVGLLLRNILAQCSDMALYKSPVPGTKKVRLGASTCISALPSELVGILLENAAMLGPDYIVDRQEVSPAARLDPIHAWRARYGLCGEPGRMHQKAWGSGERRERSLPDLASGACPDGFFDRLIGDVFVVLRTRVARSARPLSASGSP